MAETVTCPKCQGTMRGISFMEDQDVIRRIRLRRHIPLLNFKKLSARRRTGLASLSRHGSS